MKPRFHSKDEVLFPRRTCLTRALLIPAVIDGSTSYATNVLLPAMRDFRCRKLLINAVEEVYGSPIHWADVRELMETPNTTSIKIMQVYLRKVGPTYPIPASSISFRDMLWDFADDLSDSLGLVDFQENEVATILFVYLKLGNWEECPRVCAPIFKRSVKAVARFIDKARAAGYFEALMEDLVTMKGVSA